MTYQINSNHSKAPKLPTMETGGTLEDILTYMSDHCGVSLIDTATIRDLAVLGRYEKDIHLAFGLSALFQALKQGSLCMELDVDSMAELIDVTDKNTGIHEILARFISQICKDGYSRLVSGDGTEYKPLVLTKTPTGHDLYFQKYFLHEKRLKDRLSVFWNLPARTPISETAFSQCIDKIYHPDSIIRVGSDKTPIHKDDIQIQALRLAIASGFSLISGGPGTGKTSLMVNILRCLVRCGTPASRIVLAAPTGRAAQRMTEAVIRYMTSIMHPSQQDLPIQDLKGNTLHRLLRYSPGTQDFFYCRTNPIPADTVIVDEVSMVDVVLMDKLIQAVDPEKTRLILLGDKDQLPSVDAGAVLADIIPAKNDPGKHASKFVFLDTSYRSGKNLQNIGKKVNAGILPPCRKSDLLSWFALKDDQWAIHENTDISSFSQDLKTWIRTCYLNDSDHTGAGYKEQINQACSMNTQQLTGKNSGKALLDDLFNVIESNRILTLIRKGAFGVEGINATVYTHMAPFFDPAASGSGLRYFSGAPVLIRRNDYARELYNGDVGIVIRDPDGVYKACFKRFDSYVGYPMETLPLWEPAFAMTVHKCQGSEFDNIMLVLPGDPVHPMLTREMIYTAITRAKKKVLIYGSKAALNRAVKRKIKRKSGLAPDFSTE